MGGGDIDDRLTAEAADWVARLHDEAATEADWLEHETWLTGDPRRLAAYDRAERLWAEVGDLGAELTHIVQGPSAPVELAVHRKSRPPRRWVGAALAAAAAAAAIIVIAPQAFQTPTLDFQTAPGQVRKVSLQDGSIVWMNGASTMAVRMDRRSREVKMGVAEASFDVAKDPGRPFIITAGDNEIRVVGTEFNVSRTGADLSVTVRRGVVQVQPVSHASPPVRLTPGWRLTADASGAPYRVAQSSADAAFAWREGRLVYTDASLSQIAADLSRRFPTPVKVDPAVAGLKFTGVLSLDNPESVIARLEAFLPIKAHRTAQAITLSSR